MSGMFQINVPWAKQKERPESQKKTIWAKQPKTNQGRQGEQHRQAGAITKTTQLPTQIMHHSDHQFIGQSHPRLPIRSLDERCSYTKQYPWWVSKMPIRGTERLDEMDRWVNHFEAAKMVPIIIVTLDVDFTRCWFEFFVEINVINRRDKVFKDLTCSWKARNSPSVNTTSAS